MLGFNKALFNSVGLSFKELNFSKLVAIFFRTFSFSNHIACVFSFLVTMYFVMYVFHNVLLLGTLRSNDADGNENVKKTNNRFNKQNNNFARASHSFVHFFPVFARLRRENA